MLSASKAFCLPLISVSVYGMGPGFLLLSFSLGSSGQNTVNTHSPGWTHKSEQRAGLYIQISTGGDGTWRQGPATRSGSAALSRENPIRRPTMLSRETNKKGTLS